MQFKCIAGQLESVPNRSKAIVKHIYHRKLFHNDCELLQTYGLTANYNARLLLTIPLLPVCQFHNSIVKPLNHELWPNHDFKFFILVSRSTVLVLKFWSGLHHRRHHSKCPTFNNSMLLITDTTCLSCSLYDTNITVVPNVNSVGAADNSPRHTPPKSRSFLKTAVQTKCTANVQLYLDKVF